MIREILWLGFNCYYLFLTCQLKFLPNFELFVWSFITGYHLISFFDVSNLMLKERIPTKAFTVATLMEAVPVFCVGIIFIRFGIDKLVFLFAFNLLAWSCIFSLISLLYGIRKHKCKFT